ncbi:transcription repressor OFP14-like [Nicotiana tabacum]|uniref:Transcription repressor n=2 Tax=Nicotiana TaxID=4085 RepID=A0A1S3YNA7_TOBAC|nr:PREDICTED: transcription repressor OFP14 [Nicotiana sylvestris]XP_016453749.1 PREDICTED: transcription repressor OFP14-like [Nicotiana tabacum]
MPKQLQKSLSDYLSKIKHKPSPQPPNSSVNKTLSSSTSWLLRGCRHPKTPSFSAVHRKEKQAQGKDDAATLADIDRFLFENFKSFYSKDDDSEVEVNTSNKPNNNNNNIVKKGKKEDNIAPKKEENAGASNSLFESPRYVIPPSNISGSRRFFVARGSSSSLIEEARTSVTVSDDTGSTSATTNTTSNDSLAISTSDGSKETLSANDFITVVTYSPSPYDDFRQSMQEMMEARLNDQGKINWEFMEELLFCYFNLNDKKSYKYILSAFVDLIVVLRENSGRVPVISRNGRSLGGELNQGKT